MQQYFAIKEQFQDTLLLFQVGDFYELFFDDAKTASSFLAITLTKRGKNKGQDIPLCGIPVHALNHYLRKLIKGGFKVALCDQLSKPTPGTVVERGITQVFTPGTLTDSLMLDEKSASYLLALYPTQDHYGLLFSELLTAQLFATIIPIDNKRFIEAELSRFFPDEVLLPDTIQGKTQATFIKQLGYCTTFAPIPSHLESPAQQWIEEQFNESTQSRLIQDPTLKHSFDIFYSYLYKNNAQALKQFKTINFYQPEDYLVIDRATQRNLEIVTNNQDGSRRYTLFSVLDKAKTAMGSRTIKKWLLRPLVNLETIMQRQLVVTRLVSRLDVLQQSEELLGQMADLERIIGRIALKRATVHDYRALQDSLSLIPHIKQALIQLQLPLTQSIMDRLYDFSPLIELLASSIANDPLSDRIIKDGFDLELDHLRNLAENGQKEIAKLEQQEIEQTGITSLKIRYNNISGYYIEITSANRDLIPERYKHQQTLANRQRFTTPELSTLERDLTRAQNEMAAVEATVFDRVKREVEDQLSPLRHAAQALAYFDGLIGFARAGYDYRYTAPTFNDKQNIIITKGRHPVIELSTSQPFVGNNTTLANEQTLLIITGPNMGGKSTYLRQVALISIMAQCGSLVPADYAHLAILDRIFTRIGSGDNLAEGKSTFLVEMEETATICTQATKNSLVILDEVGRGTSTFDGIALAQAIIEHILLVVGARCLFATHYHELTTLSEQYPTVKNYHLQCRNIGEELIFLHTIAPGIAQGSFGLAVAHLAQLPAPIVQRAAIILKELENKQHVLPEERQQAGFCYPKNNDYLKIPNNKELAIITTLKALDINNLSPKQAFDRLWDLIEQAKNTVGL